MSTVWEVTLSAINNNKPHLNVFHVFDGDDNAQPFLIAAYFRDEYIIPLLPHTTTLMRWLGIRVKSLTAANPGDIFLSIIQTGINATGAMPTGVHIWVKLNSLDTTFRSGGKLVGGGNEGNFVGGEPTNNYLDNIQAIYDPFISGMLGAVDAALAIYRPSLSVPGVPVVGIVGSASVRGNSTNNRRRKAFER